MPRRNLYYSIPPRQLLDPDSTVQDPRATIRSDQPLAQSPPTPDPAPAHFAATPLPVNEPAPSQYPIEAPLAEPTSIPTGRAPVPLEDSAPEWTLAATTPVQPAPAPDWPPLAAPTTPSPGWTPVDAPVPPEVPGEEVFDPVPSAITLPPAGGLGVESHDWEVRTAPPPAAFEIPPAVSLPALQPGLDVPPADLASPPPASPGGPPEAAPIRPQTVHVPLDSDWAMSPGPGSPGPGPDAGSPGPGSPDAGPAGGTHEIPLAVESPVPTHAAPRSSHGTNRSKLLRLGLLAAGVFVVAVVGLWVVLGRSGAPEGQAAPGATVNSFLAALQSGDYSSAHGLLCPDLADTLGGSDNLALLAQPNPTAGSLQTYSVGEVTVDDRQAQVAYTTEFERITRNYTASLVEDASGSWCIVNIT